MGISDTFIFSTFANFFQSIWSDTSGKIFIATVVAYSGSYLLFSGYISRFTGGYGGLLLSQAGFTALDFLALLPATALLIIQTIQSFVKFLLRYVLYYVIIPWSASLIVLYFRMPIGNETSTTRTSIGYFALLYWISALGIPIAYPQYMKTRRGVIVGVGFSTLAMIIFAFSAPLDSNVNASNVSIINKILAEILAAVILFTSILLPSLIGGSLAKIAIENKLLSKIDRIVLKQPVPLPDSNPIRDEAMDFALRTNKGHWLFNKHLSVQMKPDVYSYRWSEESPVFLITSFSRTTALYFHTKDDGKNNRMVFLANDLIYLLELQSRKDKNPK